MRKPFLAQLDRLRKDFDAMQPELELTVRDSAMGVEGYVVVWNTGISTGGPLGHCGKGGTRITPTLTLDEVKMLARTMALKNAAADLPLGGAKSGLKLDPAVPGFEKQYRRFVRLCAPVLHENGGPFGGFGFDIGGRPEHALWACDELKSTRCFTGKPLNMGGTDYDREGIAGLGDPKYGGTWTFDKPLSDSLHRALTGQESDTPGARTELERRGIGVVPDFIANSGGIIAASAASTAASLRTRRCIWRYREFSGSIEQRLRHDRILTSDASRNEVDEVHVNIQEPARVGWSR